MSLALVLAGKLQSKYEQHAHETKKWGTDYQAWGDARRASHETAGIGMLFFQKKTIHGQVINVSKRKEQENSS